MDIEFRKKWLPFAILAVALCVWAALFALGAYLEPSADEPRHDWRKPLIVLGCMAGFLAFWGIALWRRSRR
jgi:membrane protein DedA with SNARE-associated domain